MNNVRRKEIKLVINEIAGLMERLRTIKDDEQDCLDNMPENLQSSTRGEASEEAIDNIESAIGLLADGADELINITM